MRLKYQLAIALSATAVILCLCMWHILNVKEPMTFFDYFVLDIATIPVQVILVGVIIERLLHEREKRAMIKKLNMVVGAFFSDTGYELLRRISSFCPETPEFYEKLALGLDWKEKDFREALKTCQARKSKPEASAEDLEGLKVFMAEKMTFILRLLQNPNLLEHDRFTDLLWAVTHMTEELMARDDLLHAPPSDLSHLSGDVSRAYTLLIREWLSYMRHLKTEYPYIYSLSVRTNPFKKDARAAIEE